MNDSNRLRSLIMAHVDEEDVLHEVDGRRVAKLRNNRGWRKTEVAKMLNIARDVISSFELRIALISGYHLAQLCNLFKVSPSHLIFGSDPGSQKRKQIALKKLAEIKQRAEDKLNNPQPKPKKKKKKKHVVRSVSRKLILSSGFETSRRRH